MQLRIKRPSWENEKNFPLRPVSLIGQRFFYFPGYLGFLKRQLNVELQPDVFLRVTLIEEYLDYLKVKLTYLCSWPRTHAILAYWSRLIYTVMFALLFLTITNKTHRCHGSKSQRILFWVTEKYMLRFNFFVGLKNRDIPGTCRCIPIVSILK